MRGLLIMLFTVFMFQVNAQSVTGDWQGKLSYEGVELRVVFHITGQSGNFQTTMDSPDQDATGIPV